MTNVNSRLSPNAEKVSAVAEITERFTNSSAAVITEYRGLSVKQVTQLRRALGRDTTYAVVKNTLTKRDTAAAGSDTADAESDTAEPVAAVEASADTAEAPAEASETPAEPAE